MLIALFVVGVSACVSSKQRAINELKEIHDILEENYTDYNAEKWRQFARDYRDVDSLLALYEYSPKEKEYIGTLRGEITGYVIKAAGHNVVNTISSEGREVFGILKGLIEVFTKGADNKELREK